MIMEYIQSKVSTDISSSIYGHTYVNEDIAWTAYHIIGGYSYHEQKLGTKLTNSMAYGTRRFNAAFTRALQ